MKKLFKEQSSHYATLSILFLSLILTAVPGLSFAAAETGSTNDPTTVIKCPEPWQVTPPDTVVTFNLSIINLSPNYEGYFLNTTGLPENWDGHFYAGDKEVRSVEIESESFADLLFAVAVQEDVASGDYPFRVHAWGMYSNASHALTITVKEFSRRIELSCPFPSQAVLTGEGLSYPIKIQNGGELTERIFLSVDVTAEMMDWRTSFVTDGQTVDNIVISARESRWIVFGVTPLYLVSPGEYSLNLVVATEDGKFNATLPLTAMITASYGLEVTGAQPINPTVAFGWWPVAAGEKAEITVTVRNIGASPVTRLRLNVTAPSELPNILVIPVDVLSLDPQESVTFFVRVSPPFGITPGDYVVRVQAVSDEAQSTFREIVISVVTPIPWYWIGISITVIATASAVIALERVISRFRIRIKKSRAEKG